MSNPFQSLKYLPWAKLFQSAGVTVLVSTLIEFLAFQLAGVLFELTLGNAGDRILGIFFAVLLPLLLAVGLGVLALLVAARLFPQIPLRKDTMWALIACLIPLILLKNFLVGGGFITLSIETIVLMTAGLFTAGRRYWRY